jgi:putative 2OG-Fe(II) oxygenase
VAIDYLISDLKAEGFVSFGPAPLSSKELDELTQLSMDVADRLSTDHPHRASMGNLAGCVQCLPQHNSRIAELLDSVFSNPDIQLVLNSVLGQDYKIWTISFRRAMPGDRGLYLHQDSLGEFGLVILASESINGSGATIFLPGSHLVKKSMKERKVEIPPYLLMKIRGLLAPLTGKVGDIAFFFNRTWHGRNSNDSSDSNDCIMVSFFPAGVSLPVHPEWSEEFLTEVQGTELGRLIDPYIGTEKQEDGCFKILSKDKADVEIPYALAIATPQRQQPCLDNFKLRAKILVISVLMAIVRPLMPLARLLRVILFK